MLCLIILLIETLLHPFKERVCFISVHTRVYHPKSKWRFAYTRINSIVMLSYQRNCRIQCLSDWQINAGNDPCIHLPNSSTYTFWLIAESRCLFITISIIKGPWLIKNWKIKNCKLRKLHIINVPMYEQSFISLASKLFELLQPSIFCRWTDRGTDGKQTSRVLRWHTVFTA